MEVLPIEACEKIKLSALDIPLIVKVDEYFQGKLKINNRIKFNLGSLLPYPITLSYHWFDADTNEVKIQEGILTQLRPELFAKTKHTYQIDVKAPEISGRYRLAVTLVQEGIRWFENMSSHHVLNGIVKAITA